MSYDPKTYGYRKSNFKGIFETDPDGFEERKKENNAIKKKMGLKARSCGDCTLCCKLVPVPALQKEGHEWCKHCAIGEGCKIYKDRPLDCQGFECFWHAGLTLEKYKPNKVGFYMTSDSANDAAMSMIKVYTEPHRLGATIRKLKKYKSPFNGSPKGFHIRFGNRKEDSCFLHVDYGENGEYGFMDWDQMRKEAEKEMAAIPKHLREKFLEKARETW
tara:strand:- start:219 stop:869 length:651 start_codon:yes stop_codon:yes gene_type:complete